MRIPIWPRPALRVPDDEGEKPCIGILDPSESTFFAARRPVTRRYSEEEAERCGWFAHCASKT